MRTTISPICGAVDAQVDFKEMQNWAIKRMVRDYVGEIINAYAMPEIQMQADTKRLGQEPFHPGDSAHRARVVRNAKVPEFSAFQGMAASLMDYLGRLSRSSTFRSGAAFVTSYFLDGGCLDVVEKEPESVKLEACSSYGMMPFILGAAQKHGILSQALPRSFRQELSWSGSDPSSFCSVVCGEMGETLVVRGQELIDLFRKEREPSYSFERVSAHTIVEKKKHHSTRIPRAPDGRFQLICN